MNDIRENKNSLEFDINTIHGAKKCMYHMLKQDAKRIEHTRGVVSRVRGILKRKGIKGDLYNKSIQSAYLHDIGFSRYIKNTNSHQVDGYQYLKKMGWSDAVSKTALLHTFSTSLISKTRSDLIKYFTEIKLTEEELFIIDLITVADLTTLPNGDPTTFDIRRKDMGLRHGPTSDQFRHIQEIEDDFVRISIQFT